MRARLQALLSVDPGSRRAVWVLVLLALAALVGPALRPFARDALDWGHLANAPALSGGHWLGTDRLGRDLLVRTLHGLRVSLAVALAASVVSVAIGLAWGSLAGWSGRAGEVMMRIVDTLDALPALFVVILLAALFPAGSLGALLLSIAALGWFTTARVVRVQTAALREREFVLAARTLGRSSTGILRAHVVPNLLGTVLVYAALAVPQMILYESFLSFLGLGVREPVPSLGNLVSEGAREMQAAPWLLLVPTSTLALLLLALNRLADGLRDALDARSR